MRYVLEDIIDANIIEINDNLIMAIRDIKKVMQDYEYHHACTCK